MRGRPATRRGTGRVARTLVTVVAASLGITLSAGTAQADPGVDPARVQQLTREVTDLAGRLTAARTAATVAQEVAAIALDQYQAKQQAFQDAEAQATAAKAAADAAALALDAAQQRLASFARSSYIDGSTRPGAAALLTVGDPGDLVERAVILGTLGQDQANVLGRVLTLRQQAEQANTAARTALASAGTLERQAAQTLTTARTAERAARTEQQQMVTGQAGVKATLDQKQAELAALIGPEAAAAVVARAEAAGSRAGVDPVSLGVLVGNTSVAGPGSAAVAQRAVAAAARYLGTPYAWGGGGAAGPGPGIDPDAGIVGFDCSGLTQYAYAQAGVRIPRNARAQYLTLPKVARTDLRPGDLVFWAQNPADPDTIHHVALYLGAARVIQAPESGDVVQISPMWWAGYAGAVRPGA